MDKLPNGKKILEGLKALQETLVFRHNNGFSQLFVENAHEKVGGIIEELTTFDESEYHEQLGGLLDLLETADPAGLLYIKDSEQNLREVRNALAAIKHEVPYGEVLYMYLEPVEGWLEGRAQSLYEYSKRKF